MTRREAALVGVRVVLAACLLACPLASLPACGNKGPKPGSDPAPADLVPTAAAAVPVAARPPPLVTSDGMPVSFAPLARRADPAVATVKARVERETVQGRRRVVSEGLGTAFVYDPDGLLLTNNHVIEDASDIEVSFFDGRELSATVVGRDKHTDVAVLRIDEHGLPFLPLGDSDVIPRWATGWSPSGNPFGPLAHGVGRHPLGQGARTKAKT